ncbi:Uncharacterised protein [Mycobacterium tuberculosis]|uniref:Uncharacterized protein n=1 Tax=Mycobacterium tuberculosis TaxID=1773 RepID=A0A655EE84_MYCTX|nr:Uncharacterised protein [Mycobacterium tuberculosis]CNV17855.1 Uncharacterised protein [Mycobacterium tuberculosis]COX20924.1 Uncharacterised protein [Mycobacterium tuberculosis]COX43725.1 Uncharacterised protein [Mycobacterium tuberculosis]
MVRLVWLRTSSAISVPVSPLASFLQTSWACWVATCGEEKVTPMDSI